MLLAGGAHAREWAPPDALLTLAERLLDAYAGETALEIPAFTDTAASPDIAYPAASISAADVQRIADRVELFVLPLMNPDGRVFSQSSPANAMWRKNRRPARPGSTCRGVDPNRNHAIAWDYERYYNAAGAAANSASKDPCDTQVYIGPRVGSEPEVRNLVSLLQVEEIDYFVDVHSFSRKLLYPWGMDGNQMRDASQNHRNREWDGRRDGTVRGPYGEYISAEALEPPRPRRRRDARRDPRRRRRRPPRPGALGLCRGAVAVAVPGHRHGVRLRVQHARGRFGHGVHAGVRLRRRRRGRLSARPGDLSEDRARGAPRAAWRCCCRRRRNCNAAAAGSTVRAVGSARRRPRAAREASSEPKSLGVSALRWTIEK